MVAPMSADPFDGLRIAQSSTAERVSDAIRDLIVQGELLGGQPLREHSLRDALGVSRNTVREALRLLSRERLVVYHLHKGVAVRQISVEDVREIFRTREPIEVVAIEYSRQAPPEAVEALLAPVEVAEVAASAGDWKAVATENLHFHQQIVDLVGSDRISAFFRSLAAELRLAFARVEHEAPFFSPFLPRNRLLAELIVDGRIEEACAEMRSYLAEAERLIAEGVAERAVAPVDGPA
jgi:DNA-binding GntR family transcriptional regulator